jgi:DNA-directed DNA polymerase III PolC
VPLHVKSHFSIGLGTASVRELAARAGRDGVPALALTDLENLYGQIQFHHACASAGVRPVTGVELRPGFDGAAREGSVRGRLVLLARDRAGYRSLCRIVSRRRAGPAGAAGGAPDPAASVAGDREGLWMLTDDPAVLERLLADGADPAALGLLLVRPDPPLPATAAGVGAARAHGVRLVADPDAVVLEEADRELQILLTAIRRKETVDRVRRAGAAESPARRLRVPGELHRLYADVPEALAESRRIADSCVLDLRDADPAFPPLDLGGRTPDEALERLAAARLAAARSRGRCAGPAYDGRLAEELGVIRRTGFAAYFLLVGEILSIARERGIRVAGRGSAAGSLVAHLLGLGDVDPLAHGLLFERLLHERRRDLPDVDLDVDSRRRDELLAAVFRRFGPDRAAMVSAHGTFGRRSAWREGLRALGMPAREVERVVRRIPAGDEAGAETPELPGRWRAAAPLLERLIGKPHYFSVHPGGVVVGEGPLADHVPLERAPKGVVATQYDLRSLRHTGLVKVDLLGNHFLAELDETLSRAAGGQPEGSGTGRRTRPVPDPVPAADPAALAAIDRADTIGCFQLESPAVRSLLARLPIRTPDDVTAALALVRPGAASGAAKEAFVRRAHGEEDARSGLHPDVASLLSGTHGLLLYEEDLIRVLSAAAGVSLAEADELRAAVVEERNDATRLAALETRFLDAALAAGRDLDAARSAWDSAVRFAAYSFSRAHAASYAVLGCQAAYLKTHAPAEFGCAVLNHHGGLYPARTIAAAVSRWGVPILAPAVNRSEAACTPEELDAAGTARDAPGPAASRAVRVGLGKVKRLSASSLRRLLASRRAEGPFADLAGLLSRVRPSAAEAEALILCGACDELPPLSADAYPFAHEALVAAIRAGAPAGVPPALQPPRQDADPARLALYRALVRIRNELRFLDVHVSHHPMRVLRPEAARHGCVPLAAAPARAGGFVRVAGLLAAARRVESRSGVMQFLTLEDETGTLEAVLFPPAWRRLGSAVTTPGPFLLEGRLEEDHGAFHLVATGLRPFHERGAASA